MTCAAVCAAHIVLTFTACLERIVCRALQLVEALNEDYSDYVGLSGQLSGLEGSVVRMRQPLLEIQVCGHFSSNTWGCFPLVACLRVTSCSKSLRELMIVGPATWQLSVDAAGVVQLCDAVYE